MSFYIDVCRALPYAIWRSETERWLIRGHSEDERASQRVGRRKRRKSSSSLSSLSLRQSAGPPLDALRGFLCLLLDAAFIRDYNVTRLESSCSTAHFDTLSKTSHNVFPLQQQQSKQRPILHPARTANRSNRRPCIRAPCSSPFFLLHHKHIMQILGNSTRSLWLETELALPLPLPRLQA